MKNQRLNIYVNTKDRQEIKKIQRDYKRLYGISLTIREAYEIYIVKKNKKYKQTNNINKENEKIFKVF